MSETTTVKRAKPVGEILIDRKLITRDQITEALAVQKGTDPRKLLGEIFVELGFCSAADVAEALADTCDVPFARITPDLPDPGTIKALPRDFIDSHTVLPLFKVDDVLTVAVAEPSNVFLIEEIAQSAGCSIQIQNWSKRLQRSTRIPLPRPMSSANDPPTDLSGNRSEFAQ